MARIRPRWVWDFVVTAGSNAVRLRRADATEVTATVAAGTYRVIGDVAGSDLLLAVKTAFEAAVGGGVVFTPSVLTTVPGGRVRISATATFGILWTDALTTWKASGRNDLGFDTAANDTGASSYDSDYQHANGWYPDKEAASELSADTSHHLVATTRAMAGVRRSLRFGSVKHHDVRCEHLDQRKILPATATPNEDLRDGLYDWLSQGKDVYFYRDVTSTTLTGRYTARDERWMEDFPAEVQEPAGPLYRVAIPMQLFVA